MGRLRVWVDKDMENGLSYIRKTLNVAATRAVGAAIALLWLALAETKEGRTIVSLNPDGSVNKHIM